MDENGKTLLRLLRDAEVYEELKAVLQEDLKKEKIGNIECDGIDPEGRFVLVCIDMDLKRLVQFQHQMRIFDGRGAVYCFGFQKDVIRKYCGESVRISEVDFEKVKEVYGL